MHDFGSKMGMRGEGRLLHSGHLLMTMLHSVSCCDVNFE